MLRNIKPVTRPTSLTILNEVLSLNAQELLAGEIRAIRMTSSMKS